MFRKNINMTPRTVEFGLGLTSSASLFFTDKALVLVIFTCHDFLESNSTVNSWYSGKFLLHSQNQAYGQSLTVSSGLNSNC